MEGWILGVVIAYALVVLMVWSLCKAAAR